MIVTVWFQDDNRVTRDADFQGHGDPDPERLAADFREIMAIESDDGLVFGLDALVASAIREEIEYGGTRLMTAAYLEKARIPVTIDIGFGEADGQCDPAVGLSDLAGPPCAQRACAYARRAVVSTSRRALATCEPSE